MTKQEVIEVARTLKYKPGWKVDLCMTGFDSKYALAWGPGCVEVALIWRALDAYNQASGAVVEVQMQDIIRGVDRMERDQFLHVIFSTIMRAEQHEAAEFFMVDGKRPFDPHRGR